MKRAIVLLVLVIVSGSLLANSKRLIPGGSAKPTGEDPHLPPPFHAVAHFLDLSQGQLQALLQLRQETEPALAEARRQVGELQVMLERSLNEEGADAEELGPGQRQTCWGWRMGLRPLQNPSLPTKS